MNINVAKAKAALIENGFDAKVENNVLRFVDAEGQERFALFNFLLDGGATASIFYTKGGKLEQNCDLRGIIAAARG